MIFVVWGSVWMMCKPHKKWVKEIKLWKCFFFFFFFFLYSQTKINNYIYSMLSLLQCHMPQNIAPHQDQCDSNSTECSLFSGKNSRSRGKNGRHVFRLLPWKCAWCFEWCPHDGGVVTRPLIAEARDLTRESAPSRDNPIGLALGGGGVTTPHTWLLGRPGLQPRSA